MTSGSSGKHRRRRVPLVLRWLLLPITIWPYLWNRWQWRRYRRWKAHLDRAFFAIIHRHDDWLQYDPPKERE